MPGAALMTGARGTATGVPVPRPSSWCYAASTWAPAPRTMRSYARRTGEFGSGTFPGALDALGDELVERAKCLVEGAAVSHVLTVVRECRAAIPFWVTLASPMEIGVYTFAELGDAGPAQRMRELLEEVELAEQVGLDVFGVGEHHRPDFVVSAPAVALAAAAARTNRIRLTSAVSVLSSDDPVRVFQEFATLDLISGGRAEIMAGRGSFIESFPLFGYDLDDYDELFAEKLELLLALRDGRARHLVGQAPRRRSTASACTRGRCRSRSRSGSPSAARPSRRSAPARSACRWRSRSSAASPSASCRSPSSTAAPRPKRATSRRRSSASTRTATSPTPRSRRATSSSRRTRR